DDVGFADLAALAQREPSGHLAVRALIRRQCARIATVDVGGMLAQRRFDLRGTLHCKQQRNRDHAASTLGRNSFSTQSTMSCVDAPGLRMAATPSLRNAASSSAGMIPPPNTTTSLAPRAFSASSTAGISVMCAPDMIDRPTASADSCTAAAAICSGV